MLTLGISAWLISNMAASKKKTGGKPCQGIWGFVMPSELIEAFCSGDFITEDLDEFLKLGAFSTINSAATNHTARNYTLNSCYQYHIPMSHDNRDRFAIGAIPQAR